MKEAQTRLETEGTQAAPLVTGHFQEGPGYATWRRHGTGDWLLVETRGGSGRFGHSGGEVRVSAGDLILLRPGVLHDYGTAGEQWDLLWVHFHPEPAWQPLLAWPEAAPGLMTLRPADTAAEKIAVRLQEMYWLATGALPRRDLLAMNALEEVLLRCDMLPRPGAPRLDPRVQAAMDILCRRLGDLVSFDMVAGECGLSVSRLSHLFREQSGLTPMQYLEQQRISRACQLLDFTTRSVTAIAAEVGYENPFYFTLRFKQHTGHSPRDYRRRVTPK